MALRTAPFRMVSDFSPAGDQPAAVAALSAGIGNGERYQTLLGITGSGKSATIAWTIEQVQKPTLVIAPNKSLAAQLANEFREFFPDNRVEYFVSYYDYYQPEAYIASSDTYIEKDSSVNDEIDRLRHSATAALLTRRDVIVVASVSCIYGLGSPEEYRENVLFHLVGDQIDQRSFLRTLVDMHYDRNDANLTRGKFRVRGDTIEVHPAYEETILRIELFGDEIERIAEVDPLTGEQLRTLDDLWIYPATHYVAGEERMRKAIVRIEAELAERLAYFEKHGKLLEAQRLRMRTQYDLEMMQEVGYCNGIENYSGPIDGRAPGETPHTLLDFFPDDYLCLIDEINARTEADQRVLVTTLTKKMAEDLTDYLLEQGLRVRYLHSNIDTIERIEILRSLRLGEFDVLVGINLLREGLDLPEVSLVAILDADKEGFLRSETSLIQTTGRAARNVDGQVIMYADTVTDSMRRAIGETQRRRHLQIAYNAENGFEPQTIRKAVNDILAHLRPAEGAPVPGGGRRRARPRAAERPRPELAHLPPTQLGPLIQTLEEEMHEAAADLRFEYAARLRDEVNELKRELREAGV